MDTTKIKKFYNQTILKLEKNSPEILFGLGVVSFIGTVVLASKATIKAQDILFNHQENIGDIHAAKRIAEESEGELKNVIPEDPGHGSLIEYDEDLYKKDLVVAYSKTAVGMVKTYAPAVGLGVLSVACFLTSKRIMDQRYLGAVAAYNGVSAAFKEYRKRVVESEGVEKDRFYRYGAEYSSIVEADEKGKKKEVKAEFVEGDAVVTECSVIFDESNPNWDSNPAINMLFLRGQQNMLNDRLHIKGHVFLNDVYEALGFPHTPQGALLGWVEGEGDDEIKFGLENIEQSDVRRFVNGQENIILLEFNHDGPIWDRI